MSENDIWKLLSMHHSRLLSQLDRDPDSPSFGSFDRNFWNYKIRDFSSIILQQGILYLDALYSYENLNNVFYKKEDVKKWIQAGLDFWSNSQLKTGAFNEYYPNESGFPPTSFSLYAVSIIIEKYPEFRTEKIINSVNKAIKWLMNIREEKALNQESAGLAAIVVASSLDGVEFDIESFNIRLNLFYEGQSSEGWFNEYDGPDMGYLSVTIDSLWDIYKYSGDSRALKALEKAVDFIYNLISISGQTPIMINSRNTDYLVPYGLSGYASMNPKAASLVSMIIHNLDNEDSIFSKTDDRYLSHYVGQSFMRSLYYLDETMLQKTSFLEKKLEIYYKESGIYIKHIPHKKSIYVAAKKGGVINVFNESSIELADYGWRYKAENKIATTHWQNKNNIISYDNSTIKVSGNFVLQRFIRPSLFTHFSLRIVSLLIGNKLIPFLKSKFIFSEKNSGVVFHRQVSINDSEVIIDDQFENLDGIEVYKSKQYSMRHVSSANRFNYEELL